MCMYVCMYLCTSNHITAALQPDDNTVLQLDIQTAVLFPVDALSAVIYW